MKQTRLLLLLMGLWSTAPIEAQTLSVTGRVHLMGDSSRLVADAEVALLPGLRVVRTDSMGAFSFHRLRAGSYTVRVRKVGFEPARADVVVESGGATEAVYIPLRTGPQLLAEVVVSGQRLLYPARLAEPYARLARGRGAFFTRELIDSLQPWDLSTLLVRVPGVRVNDRVIDVGRCVGHATSPVERGKLHVFLDGVRQTSYASYLSQGALEALRGVAIASVQLVEVHTSINTIPPEYADDACAVILLWSR